MKKTIRDGKNTTIINDGLDDSLSSLIDKLLPDFQKEILKEMEIINDNAQRNWLVRKKNSKRSVDKMKFGIRIKGFEISGFVQNLAPYAWAIRVGPKSSAASSSGGSVPVGKRLAGELLEKPLFKASERLTKKLAESIIKLQK